MTNRTFVLGAVAAIVIVAAASPASAEGFFGPGPVADATLGEIRGTFRPYSGASSPQLRVIEDEVSRDDARVFGSIGGVIMDIWWAEVGTNVR